MQMSRYAPKLVLGDTLLGQRHKEEGTALFMWLARAHDMYTQLRGHMQIEGRPIMQCRDSLEDQMILL